MKVFLEEMAKPYLIRIVEQDKEKIEENLNKIWAAKKDSIIMDGFRKGKVPQDIAEKQYGFTTLYKEYIDQVISNAISQINTENDVTIVDLQQVIPEQLNKNGFVMQAVAYLKPTINSLDYSNVNVTKLVDQATDEEVNQQLSLLQDKNALIAPITDRGVEFGDIINVSYVGSQNQIPFQGGTASKQEFTLTEKAFIPGFGEAIIGMKPNETKTFSVVFPEEYQAQNLAGKQAEFDLTVHEIKKKVLPDLDDEFAITCGNQNLDELKATIKQRISEKKKDNNRSKTETEICLELVKRADITPFPQTMIQKRLATLLQQELNNFGITEEQYLTQRKITRETFDRMYYPIAQRDLKIQLILDHIANQEKLEASEKEVQDYLTSEAERLGYTVEQLNNLISKDQIEAQVRLRKGYDFLLANANYLDEIKND